jgi:pimeloyl-ACP methyl ester carboxylesterase
MPKRVEKLILFGFTLVGSWAPDNPLGTTEKERAGFETILELDFDSLMNAFWEIVAQEPGTIAWKEAGITAWKELGESTLREFLRDAFLCEERHLLDGVSVPTLVIAGEYDVASTERIRHMADSIEGAQFALIEGASHMAPWSATDTFVAILREFIDTGRISREVWQR